jgi:hypothetical protein
MKIDLFMQVMDSKSQNRVINKRHVVLVTSPNPNKLIVKMSTGDEFEVNMPYVEFTKHLLLVPHSIEKEA